MHALSGERAARTLPSLWVLTLSSAPGGGLGTPPVGVSVFGGPTLAFHRQMARRRHSRRWWHSRGEQLTFNQVVAGSIPARPTRKSITYEQCAELGEK